MYIQGSDNNNNNNNSSNNNDDLIQRKDKFLAVKLELEIVSRKKDRSDLTLFIPF